jgi:hypothetical protein
MRQGWQGKEWIHWPGGGEEPEPPRRWQRAREPWEQDDDGFDGEAVLRDLPAADERAGRIIARYLAVALLRRAVRDRASLAELAVEREEAAAYTAALTGAGPMQREARALRALVALARAEPPRRTLQFLQEAAEAALGGGQAWGAFGLQREAYWLAVERRWWPEAARAATMIGRIAERGGGRWSARLWRMRARVLDRRALRQAADGPAGG